MIREEPAWMKAIYGGALVLYGWLFRQFLGWAWWEAGIVAIFGAVLTALAVWLARDTWPLAVPDEMYAETADWKDQGWRLARMHPWWRCRLKIPHVHLVKPERPHIAREHILREDQPWEK